LFHHVLSTQPVQNWGRSASRVIEGSQFGCIKLFEITQRFPAAETNRSITCVDHKYRNLGTHVQVHSHSGESKHRILGDSGVVWVENVGSAWILVHGGEHFTY